MKKHSVLFLLAIVLLPLVIVSVTGISYFAEQRIKQLAVRLATEATKDLATATHAAIEGPMLSGRDEETRDVFRRLATHDTASVRIVSARFPDLPLITYSSLPGEDQPVINKRLLIDQVYQSADALDQISMLSRGDRSDAIVVDETAVTVLETIPNARECLHCHANVDTGAPLGIVSVCQDMGSFLVQTENTANFLMLFIAGAETTTILLISLLFWLLTLRPLSRLLRFVGQVGDSLRDHPSALNVNRFYGRETRSLAAGMNQMLSALEEKDRFVVDTIGGAMDKLKHIIHQLLGEFGHIRQGVSTQAVASVQIGEAMAEISTAASNISAEVGQSVSAADTVSQRLDTGRQVTRQMLEAIGQTREVVRESRESSAETAAMANEIVKIVVTIDDIAFQTNLLALNAAVEAARAGRHGKGFAVVAQHVRNLAGQSARAAHEIQQIIETATGKMTRAVEQGEQIKNHFESTAGLAENVADLINELSVFIDGIAAGVNQINDAAAKQAAATEETLATSEGMAETNRQAEASVKHMADIVEDLKSTTGRLADLTSRARSRS